jgi:hypothetical protein
MEIENLFAPRNAAIFILMNWLFIRRITSEKILHV